MCYWRKFRPLGASLLAVNANGFAEKAMCIDFSTELTVFSKFLELFMDVFVQWCQLPYMPMVSVIIVSKNKAINAASKLL